jgi:hypothetical protein
MEAHIVPSPHPRNWRAGRGGIGPYEPKENETPIKLMKRIPAAWSCKAFGVKTEFPKSRFVTSIEIKQEQAIERTSLAKNVSRIRQPDGVPTTAALNSRWRNPTGTDDCTAGGLA